MRDWSMLHAEATQSSEVYLRAELAAHDRVKFIPGEIFPPALPPLRPGLLSLALK